MYHSSCIHHDHGQALHLTAASPERGSSIDGPGAKCRVSRVSRVSPGLAWLGPACRCHGKGEVSWNFYDFPRGNHGEIMGKWMENRWKNFMGLKPQLGPQFLFVGSFPFGRCLVILTGPDWSKEDCPKVSWAPRQVGPAARLVRSPPAT